MLFPDEALFDYVLIDLAEGVAARPAPPMQPLPCDRYVARSCLQKAIRRGEPELALRALANMFEYDRRATWRALTIICVEDVGVADVDLLAQIVAAQRNRKWREQVGGDWVVLTGLIRRMATSAHCQAACDLLLRVTNDPSLEHHRAAALERTAIDLAAVLWNGDLPIVGRGAAALAMGGGLADGQQHHDPCGVFDILSDTGRSSHVVAACRAAWKLTRNPMALLLPLVWQQRMLADGYEIADDEMPPVQMIDGVPGYALDQFTRIGNTISRALLRADPELGYLLSKAGIRIGGQPRAVGDLLFLLEGGLVANRVRWEIGDHLRLPWRDLPSTVTMGDHVPTCVKYLRQRVRQIDMVRRSYFPSGVRPAA